MRLCPFAVFAAAAVWLILAGAAPTPAAEIAVDGGTCTLADAIRSANDDGAPAGSGCADGAGADVVLLTASVVVEHADAQAVAAAGDAAYLLGGRAGLPDVTSEVTLRAAGGVTLRRGAAGCEPGEGDAYRLLTVRAGGSLRLEGITLSGGCVAAGSGEEAAGGAVLVVQSSLAVSGGAFLGNGALGGPRGAGEPAAAGDAAGGAIAVGVVTGDGTGTVLTIAGTLFDGNAAFGGAEGNGGGDARGGAVAVRTAELVTIAGATLRASSAIGGGVSTAVSPGDGNGGALYVEEAAVDVRDSLFEGNQALGGAAPGSAGGGGGGAIDLRDTPGTLQRLIVADNLAAGGQGTWGPAEGGALRSQLAGPAVRDSLFRANAALATGSMSALGGAVSWRATSGEIAGCTFDGNFAEGDDGESPGAALGGGLWAGSPGQLAALANCTFHGNTARGGDDLAGIAASALGGGLMLGIQPAVLSHLTIAGNYALGGAGGAFDGEAHGGGLLVSTPAPLALDNSVLANNHVLSAGSPSPNDCETYLGSSLSSQGFNLVDAPGDCDFDDPNDRPPGTAAGLLPLGDYGCLAPLPDGTCLPTMALRRGFAALDGGSCATSGVAADARGVARPDDYPGASAADDGCDSGAFEAFAGAFHALTPCRLVDTREAGNSPALTSDLARTFTFVGSCAIPPNAVAVALNATVTGPTGGGHVTLYPGGSAAPATSTLNFSAAQTRANNAVLPLAAGGAGTLSARATVTGGGTVHLIVDVVGYFE